MTSSLRGDLINVQFSILIGGIQDLSVFSDEK